MHPTHMNILGIANQLVDGRLKPDLRKEATHRVYEALYAFVEIVEASWKAIGATAEEAEASDDPETRSLPNAIRITLDYEKERCEQLRERLASREAEIADAWLALSDVPGPTTDLAKAIKAKISGKL